MDKQEIFNKVARHLLEQKSSSTRDGACAYRGTDGKMCAIGCLIDDSEYSPRMESQSVTGLYRAGLMPSRFEETEDMIMFLTDLQRAHDDFLDAPAVFGLYIWKTWMEQYGIKNGLDISVLQTIDEPLAAVS